MEGPIKYWRLLIILGVGALGSLLGARLLPRVLAPWEHVAVPGPVAAILAYDDASALVVRLRDGRVLGCSSFSRACAEQRPTPQRRDTCGPPRSAAPAPPAPAQASLAFEMCGVDTTISQHFVLLASGEVWHWETFHSGRSVPYWVTGAILGGVAGLAAGAIGSALIVIE